MLGAPATAVQELAGHADLATTLRYIHLSPGAKESALGLLDERERLTGSAPGAPPRKRSREVK